MKRIEEANTNKKTFQINLTKWRMCSVVTCLLGAEHLPVLEPGQLAHWPVDDGGPAAQDALAPLVP